MHAKGLWTAWWRETRSKKDYRLEKKKEQDRLVGGLIRKSCDRFLPLAGSVFINQRWTNSTWRMDEGHLRGHLWACSANLTVRRLELYITTNVEAQNSLSLQSVTVSLQQVKQKKTHCELSLSHLFPHNLHFHDCQRCLQGLYCVTLWKLHLPKKGGRYDTASRNGLVSTCLSAGSCLNWCSINRAISPVRTHSYLWNDRTGCQPLCCRFTVTHTHTHTHRHTHTHMQVTWAAAGGISSRRLLWSTGHW